MVVRLDASNGATFKQLILEEGKQYLKALNLDWSNGFYPVFTDSDNSLNYELAMDVIEFFQLDRRQALKIIDEVLAGVGNWKAKASAVELSRGEQKLRTLINS